MRRYSYIEVSRDRLQTALDAAADNPDARVISVSHSRQSASGLEGPLLLVFEINDGAPEPAEEKQ